MPLLAHFLPLQFVVPFVLTLDLVAAAVLSGNNRHQIHWGEVWPLVPFGTIGVILGVSLLLSLPKGPLLSGLGLFVLIFGIRNLLNIHGEKPISRLWAAPAGLVGGLVGALFSTGGPPFIVYLSHRLKDKATLRATFSGLFMLEGGLRLAVFAIAGLLLQDGMAMALLLALPVMAAGLYLGHRIHLGISGGQMLRLVGLLLAASGISLIWKAWV